MTHKEALEHLATGGKVKLPEWTGYWFEHPDQPGKVWAFTKHGDVVPAWAHRMDMIMREDWEEVKAVGLGFDWAINALQAGKRVQRNGWNGKNMWLILIQPGNAMHTSSAGHFPMLPCIGMKTATGEMCPGWLASQTDMLASDWQLAD